jgi:hypothetical protein
MEKKEISIYWLLDKIISKKHTDSELNYIFQQAEAMHKKEIEETYNQACLDAFRDDNKYGRDYYNETYGGTQC